MRNQSSLLPTTFAGCTDCLPDDPVMGRRSGRSRQSIVGLMVLAAEHGHLPDIALRRGIRVLLKNRLRELNSPSHSDHSGVDCVDQFVAATVDQPIAVATHLPNEQHYEVPAQFFETVLGPMLKYSTGYWASGVNSLAAAEKAALQMTCQNADLQDGMNVLELGCGWGSLSLWMAREHPHSRITAVSNSHSQRLYIERRAMQYGLGNLQVITADMQEFDPDEKYDRVVSVEMFEHMRNHRELMTRICNWMKPSARLLVHHFCHRTTPYLFESDGEQNWMGRHFFSGGMMPCPDLLDRCGSPLRQISQSKWNGTHYARTCRAWLARQDAGRDKVHDVLTRTYGPDQATRWHNRWRMFFMACEELFGYRNGQEWFVVQSLFDRG